MNSTCAQNLVTLASAFRGYDCDPDHASFRGAVYLRAQFDDSSFSHFIAVVGTNQNLNGTYDLTTPLLGMLYHLWAIDMLRSTCLSNLKSLSPPSKEDMEGDTKCRK